MASSSALEDLVAAYEGLEDPASFPDSAAVRRYRAALLERTAEQADFLLPRLGAAARVLEVGCGNGRLLLALAQRGALTEALGLDLSESRISFARQWAAEERRGELRFETADITRFALPPEHFSAALCITGAFAYFEPLGPGSALALAAQLRAALEPGGTLCLELYPHPTYRRLMEAAGGPAQVWHELPPNDPWRFYLSRLSLDASGNVLTHEKTFVHRLTAKIDSGRRERLYLYTASSIEDLLVSAGFDNVCLYGGWSDERYSGGELMIVTARKPS